MNQKKASNSTIDYASEKAFNLHDGDVYPNGVCIPSVMFDTRYRDKIFNHRPPVIGPLGQPNGSRPFPVDLNQLLHQIEQGLPGYSGLNGLEVENAQPGVRSDISTHAFNSALIRNRISPMENQVGSGTFISDKWILTAAHVVAFFKNPKSQNVWIHYNVGNGPAIYEAFPQEAYVCSGWDEESENYDRDIGLIKITTGREKFVPGQIGYYTPLRPYTIQNDESLPLLIPSFYGRPGNNLDTSLLKFGRGHIKEVHDDGQYRYASHDAKTWNGWSGSPLLYALNDVGKDYRLVGLHVHGKTDANLGVLFAPSLVTELLSIRSGTQPSEGLWRKI